MKNTIFSLALLSGLVLNAQAHASCKDLVKTLIDHNESTAELAKSFFDYEHRLDNILWTNSEKKKTFKARGDSAAAAITKIQGDLNDETYHTVGVVGGQYNCDIQGALDSALFAAQHYNFKNLNAQLNNAKDAITASRKMAEAAAKRKGGK